MNYNYIMKPCSNCSIVKSTSEYYFRDKIKGVLHTSCKQCYTEKRKLSFKKHYEKYGDEYRKRALIRKQRIVKIRRAQILEYFRGKYCANCGITDVRVLDFDHIDRSSKSFAISKALTDGLSWGKIIDEIGKCQILCANCHRIRTSEQFNWYKS